MWLCMAHCQGQRPLSPGHTAIHLLDLGLWYPSVLLARGENWFLNVVFVFLLAKFNASWLLESCLREKKGHVRREDEKESLAIPGEEGFGSWVVL